MRAKRILSTLAAGLLASAAAHLVSARTLAVIDAPHQSVAASVAASADASADAAADQHQTQSMNATVLDPCAGPVLGLYSRARCLALGDLSAATGQDEARAGAPAPPSAALAGELSLLACALAAVASRRRLPGVGLTRIFFPSTDQRGTR